MPTSAPPVLLFSYGTLQKKTVQMTHFGRELTGRPDELPGFTLRTVPVGDPKVVELIGESEYVNAEPAAGPNQAIAGVVFEITERELATADRYEEAARYRRIAVTLRSGVKAWLYVLA